MNSVKDLRRKQSGFTLTELMIVISIIAILSTVAYPSYNSYVKKTFRQEAQGYLMSLTSDVERHFTLNNTYVSALGANPVPGADDLANRYEFTFATTSPTAYTITATPQEYGGQDEEICGIMVINQLGTKTDAANDVVECW